MHDVLRKSGKPVKRFRTIKVGDDRNDPQRTKVPGTLIATGQCVNAPAAAESPYYAQSDIAATDDQKSSHETIVREPSSGMPR